jgi:hypothetical protein
VPGFRNRLVVSPIARTLTSFVPRKWIRRFTRRK